MIPRVLRPVSRYPDREDRDLARTPNFGPLLLQGSLAVFLAIAGAVGLYLFLAWLLGVSPHLVRSGPGEPSLPLADQQKLLTDLVKVALGLAAGIGAAFALVVSYRRARAEEAGSHRDDRRLFSSRYQDAADLIGSDKAAVRLAGIYAMARLADDWVEQRQQCIDVLCAYLRLPYDPDPDTGDLGEREVRYSVIGLIRSHLRPAARPSWHGRNFDFNGAVSDGGNFRGAEFGGGTVDFSGARFGGGTISFLGAEFSGGRVSFRGSEFSGGTVDFSDAKVGGGTISFFGAEFSGGTVEFTDAKLSGGSLNCRATIFSGGDVTFQRAEFGGSRVYFQRAQFNSGTVDFGGAAFSGSHVYFRGAQFNRSTVDFGGAEFSGGTVDLTNTELLEDGIEPQGFPQVRVGI